MPANIPWPREDTRRCKKDHRVRLAHTVREESSQVRKLVRVEEDGTPKHSTEQVLEIASIRARLDLVMR